MAMTATGIRDDRFFHRFGNRRMVWFYADGSGSSRER